MALLPGSQTETLRGRQHDHGSGQSHDPRNGADVYNPVVTLDRVVNTGDGQFDPNLTPMLAGTSSCPDTFTIASSRRSWQATVVSGDGEEIALTGRYDEGPSRTAW